MCARMFSKEEKLWIQKYGIDVMDRMNKGVRMEKEGFSLYNVAKYKMIIISKNKIEESNKIRYIKLVDYDSDWRFPSVNWKQMVME